MSRARRIREERIAYEKLRPEREAALAQFFKEPNPLTVDARRVATLLAVDDYWEAMNSAPTNLHRRRLRVAYGLRDFDIRGLVLRDMVRIVYDNWSNKYKSYEQVLALPSEKQEREAALKEQIAAACVIVWREGVWRDPIRDVSEEQEGAKIDRFISAAMSMLGEGRTNVKRAELPDDFGDTAAGLEDNPEWVLLRREAEREAARQVASLDLSERDLCALIMREAEDREYDEIAAELDTTEGNARLIVHRAKSRARKGLTG